MKRNERTDGLRHRPGSKTDPSRPLHFLIVDDYPIVRSGLRKALSDHFTSADFALAADAGEALAAGRSINFDAILLDLVMPDRNGLELLPELQTHTRDAPILIVTVHGDERLALMALAAGAAGFIEKSAAVSTLILAVEEILGGGTYLSEKMTKQISIRLGQGSLGRLRRVLSPLEFAVLLRLAGGRTAAQISAELSADARKAMAEDLQASERSHGRIEMTSIERNVLSGGEAIPLLSGPTRSMSVEHGVAIKMKNRRRSPQMPSVWA